MLASVYIYSEDASTKSIIYTSELPAIILRIFQTTGPVCFSSIKLHRRLADQWSVASARRWRPSIVTWSVERDKLH